MKCQNARELLSSYIDGVLSEKEKSSLERHLASCSRCSREAAQLRYIIETLHGLEEATAPSDFMSVLHEKLMREKVVPFQRPQAPDVHRRFRTGWAVASVAGIALAVGIYVSSLVPYQVAAQWFEKLPVSAWLADDAPKTDIEKLIREKQKEIRTAEKASQQNPAPAATGSVPTARPAEKTTTNTPDSKTGLTVAAVGKEEATAKPGKAVSAPAKNLLIDTVSMQVAAKDASKVSEGILKLAANNQGVIENGSAQIMAGTSKVITLWVPRERVDAVVSGVESLADTSNPVQGRVSITDDYDKTSARLNAVQQELTALKSKSGLNDADVERIRNMEYETSYLKGELDEMNRNLGLVAVKVEITQEIKP